MAKNSLHVFFFFFLFFFQESWNLKHKVKVAGQRVGLNFGTAPEILSKEYKYIIRKCHLKSQTFYFHVMFCRNHQHPDIFLSRFESCWPAIMKDSCGVVIIFNPDVKSHLKEIETWHSMFISPQSLQESQCLLIAHQKPGSEVENGRLQLGTGTHTAGLVKLLCLTFMGKREYSFHAASYLSKLQLIHSNLEEEPELVRQGFIRYLGNVVKALSERREQEEMSIIT